MHSEGVYETSFMVRKGSYKYIYIHGHQPQLFDLDADPEEWNSLAGKPEYAAVQKELEKLVLERFDPVRIERELRESIARRMLIRKAMRANGTDWSLTPDEVREVAFEVTR